MTPDELVAARQALGLAQTTLAARLGVNGTTVWRWEHGKVPVPRWLPLAMRGLQPPD